MILTSLVESKLSIPVLI